MNMKYLYTSQVQLFFLLLFFFFFSPCVLLRSRSSSARLLPHIGGKLLGVVWRIFLYSFCTKKERNFTMLVPSFRDGMPLLSVMPSPGWRSSSVNLQSFLCFPCVETAHATTCSPSLVRVCLICVLLACPLRRSPSL